MNPTKVAFFKETQNATDREIQRIRELDPTSNCDNAAWLLRGIRGNWFNGFATTELRDALLTFARLKTSPKMKEMKLSTDLNQYGSLPELLKITKDYWDYLSNKQRNREIRGAELVYHEGPWKMYRVFEVKAAQLLSSGSNWCTTQENQAVSYLGKCNLWAIMFYDKPYCQMHVETGQCQDRQNRDFYTTHGKCKFLMDYHVGRILHLHTQYADIQRFLKDYSPVMEPAASFYETMKYKAQHVVVAHLSFFQKRVPEIEEFLDQDFSAEQENNLLLYLSHFENHEDFIPRIKNSAVKAWAYCLNFKRALPEGKQDLLNGTSYFIPYLNRFGDVPSHKFTGLDTVQAWVNDNPQVRNESAEAIIFKNLNRMSSDQVLRYSRLAVKGRWAELEAHDNFKKLPEIYLNYGKEFSFAPVPVANVIENINGEGSVQLFEYIITNCTADEKKAAFGKVVGRANFTGQFEYLNHWIAAHMSITKSAQDTYTEEYLNGLETQRVKEGLNYFGSNLKEYFKTQPVSEVLCKIATNQEALQEALLNGLKERNDLFESWLTRFEKRIAQAYITRYSVKDEKLMLATLDLTERYEYALKNGIRLPEEDEKQVTTWKRLNEYAEKCLGYGVRSQVFEKLFLDHLAIINESAVKAFKTYAAKAFKTSEKAKMEMPEEFKKKAALTPLIQEIDPSEASKLEARRVIAKKTAAKKMGVPAMPTAE